MKHVEGNQPGATSRVEIQERKEIERDGMMEKEKQGKHGHSKDT